MEGLMMSADPVVCALFLLTCPPGARSLLRASLSDGFSATYKNRKEALIRSLLLLLLLFPIKELHQKVNESDITINT